MGPLCRLAVAPDLLRVVAVRHPVLARVALLLDSPRHPLAAALQSRPLFAPQEREPRAVVRPGDAPGGAHPLLQRRSHPLGSPRTPNPFPVQRATYGADPRSGPRRFRGPRLERQAPWRVL